MNKSLMEEVHHRTQMAHEAMEKEPQVGMFWVVNGNLVIDGVPLSEADQWGDYKAYPKTHEQMWPRYQRAGLAPQGVAWDAAPRGWVSYEVRTQVFHLIADACILSDAVMMSRIKADLNLPPAPHTVSEPRFSLSLLKVSGRIEP